MERPSTTLLRIGAWRVDPLSSQISRDGESIRLETRTMRLLMCLADHAGQVVSIDDLLNQVWPEVIVSPDSVYQAVASLRKLLGDDSKQPAYIATVPRLGYRLVAAVSPSIEEPVPAPAEAESKAAIANPPMPGPRRKVLWAIAATICLAAVIVFVLLRANAVNHRRTELPATAPQQAAKSIAVLPFLDLTEGMREGEFADGMTEELIDKLSKLPGLHVPSPTSSFYYRDKEMPVADIAKALGVVYVLDGSVRKSGARVRVAARLIRADNGYVVWSETYDRPFHDLLMVQDDIAGEVTKALSASTELNTH